MTATPLTRGLLPVLACLLIAGVAQAQQQPVSYTHLTLPTIYSV